MKQETIDKILFKVDYYARVAFVLACVIGIPHILMTIICHFTGWERGY